MRKILNHKVTLSAHGNEITLRVSDEELGLIRSYSIPDGKDRKKATSGFMYNFSAFAMFDYEKTFKGKSGRFYATFDYHKFDKMYWYIND